MNDQPEVLDPAAADLATLDGHALAILAYARGRFRASWHALSAEAQADVTGAAGRLAKITLCATKGANEANRLRDVREFMRAWTWAGRRAAAKHLQRGAAHVAFEFARGLAGDERRAALRHSADLMRGRHVRVRRKR